MLNIILHTTRLEACVWLTQGNCYRSFWSFCLECGGRMSTVRLWPIWEDAFKTQWVKNGSIAKQHDVLGCCRFCHKYHTSIAWENSGIMCEFVCCHAIWFNEGSVAKFLLWPRPISQKMARTRMYLADKERQLLLSWGVPFEGCHQTCPVFISLTMWSRGNPTSQESSTQSGCGFGIRCFLWGLSLPHTSGSA